MNYLTKKDLVNLSDNAKFEQVCQVLYGSNCDIEYQSARYSRITAEHCKHYDNNILLFSSPGRIEVCGNHTDHNNGKVLCASISVDTLAVVTPVEGCIITVASEGYPPLTVNIDDLKSNSGEYGTSEALVRGVCAYFVNHGYAIGGFYATTTSDVFKGAGVSSSASFEVLICEILNNVYNKGVLDAVTKAKAAHHAESVYFGKPCGLMDQSAIALGGVSFIDFKSTDEPIIEKVEFNMDLDIVLCNCGGDHCGLTDEYAAIRLDMEAVAKALGAKKLRFASKKKLMNKLPKLQDKFTGRQILRAIHFYDENIRVEKAVKAIKSSSANAFRKMITESGSSSYEMLQNCYVCTDKLQRIPLALAIIKSANSSATACRVHGGGFAGTVIAFSNAKGIDVCKSNLDPIFGENNVHKIQIRNVGTCQVEI